MSTDARPFASLPMYDWPEVGPAWDALWRETRARLAGSGIDAAGELRRDADHAAAWLSPGLLLGQTCGWPLVSRLAGNVRVLARFAFDTGRAAPGDYHSVFVMRRGDATQEAAGPVQLGARLPGARVAYNSVDSQSGFRALSELFARPVALPASRTLATGSHRASIRAVAAGQADLAAIDAVTWRLALAHEPAARKLAVAACGRDVPGLPLICAPAFGDRGGEIVSALAAAVAAMPAAPRRALGLNGVVPASAGDYDVLRAPPFGNFSLR
jgi:ABC-type phosphate/phosphonate transport system substrate-binding protein